MCQTNNGQSNAGDCKSTCKHAGTGRCAAARAALLDKSGRVTTPLDVIQQTDRAEPGCIFRGVDESQGVEFIGPKY